ncbi:MAG: hypothetical protein ACYCZO_08875 [Daejeonella sp.]
MINNSAVLQEECQEQYIIQQVNFNDLVEIDEVLSFTELELFVSDSETGRPISSAMISLDAINRTAVCDNQGKVVIYKILAGTYPVDVIVPGYIAYSRQIHLSDQMLNYLAIKMIRNC